MRLRKNVFFLDESAKASNEQKEMCLLAAKHMADAGSFDMFNRLVIILTDFKGGDSKSTRAWVRGEEASAGKYRIYLIAPLAKNKMSVVRTLRHEKAHLLEYVYSSPATRQDSEELSKILSLLKTNTNRLTLIRFEISSAKYLLNEFTKKIRSEGIAEYAKRPHALGRNVAVLQKGASEFAAFRKSVSSHIELLNELLNETIRRRKRFKKLVSMVLSESKPRGKLNQSQTRIIKQAIEKIAGPIESSIKSVSRKLKFLFEEGEGAAYVLGENMSYVILWRFRNMRPQDLIKIDHIRFLKLYSKARRSLNIIPAFTYKDYVKYIDILNNLDKEFVCWEKLYHTFDTQLSWFSRLKLKV